MNFRPAKAVRPALAALGVLALGMAAPGVLSAQAPAAPAAVAPANIPVALRPDQVALIVEVLSEAESHGFARGEFAPADLDKLLASQDPAERARGAALLGAGSVRYAQAQRGGRVPGKAFLNDWSIRPEPFAAGSGFAQAAASNTLDAWFASLPPPYQGYQTLRAALARYRGLAAAGGWPKLPAGELSLKPGMDDPRTPILRQRLAVEDPDTPAAAEDPAKPNLFDPGLVKALGRFQQRHGIKPDGAMGKDTLAELNRPVEYRIGQVLANMERWRWLPRTAPADRIEVNIAAQTLERYQANKLTMFMRTVAGRKTDKTPILRSDIRSVVLNPPWNVPTSIANKELWPKQRADPSYFEKEEISVQPNGTLQQRAGSKSALGKFKFDFINSFGVYLHDTPAQSAFDREARDVSHGCVRLEKPADLAKALLSGSREWPVQKIDATLQSGDTTRARLPQPVPVYLLYWTVYQDAQAQLNFRRDIYDWDAQLLRLLDAGKTHA